MKKLFAGIFMMLFAGYALGQQQKVTLKGIVEDSITQRPLFGPSLSINHIPVKVDVGKDGRFKLSVELNDTLGVKHVGYLDSRIRINNVDTLIVIRMKPVTNELNVVEVNTGYQSIPKERATGSFDLISNKLYNEQVRTNVLDGIQYIANGLAVNNRLNSPGLMTIRGLNTITGPKAPLIIIDNFPYDGDLANINPNDVKNITILKDAAAASIWGARAGNGVIVITTKSGSFNTNSKIEFTSSVTITPPPDLFYYHDMTSKDYVEVEEYLFDQGYRFSDTARYNKPPFSPVYEVLFQKRNGQIGETEADAILKGFMNHDVRNDFNKLFYQNSVHQQYNLNVSGGGGRVAYALNGGYDNDISNLDADYKRLTIRSTNTFKVSKDANITAGFAYTYTHSTSGKPSYGSIGYPGVQLPLYSSLVDEMGNPVPLYKDYRQTYIDTIGEGLLKDWNYYPATDYQYNHVGSSIHDLVGNLGITYRLPFGFSISAKYQYERQEAVGEALYDDNSYYTRNLINSFSQIDWNNNEINLVIPDGDIANNTNTVIESHHGRGQLNYHLNKGNNEISILAGGEISQSRSSTSNYTIYGLNTEVMTNVNMDYANDYPQLVTGATAHISGGPSFDAGVNKFVSLFANGAYTYKGKYTISGSARRDASNVFGMAVNNRWTPLWSGGLAWNFSKESFYNIEWLPELKARVTYGYSGNVDMGLAAVTTISYGYFSSYTKTSTANFDNFSNPDLQWEQTGMLNVGLDFALNHNVISGSVEYYHKRSDNLYGPYFIDQTVGLRKASITKNVAAMSGNGVDIKINSVNINRKLKWITDLNFNLNRDKITKYYLEEQSASYYINGGTGINGLKGYPVYSVFAYKWAGLDPQTGDPMGYLDGEVSKDYTNLIGGETKLEDLKYMGPSMPPIFGTVGNTVTWKGWSISARLAYEFGFYFSRESIEYSRLLSLHGHIDYEKRWQKPGDEVNTDVPSFIYPLNLKRNSFYDNSEVLIEKGDNIRLQYVNLGYTFLLNRNKGRKGIELNANFVVNNIGILWRANDKDLDPDYRSSAIPPSRNYSFAINLKF